MKEPMNAEQMIKAITEQNELIKEKDKIISRLAHLLDEKSKEARELKEIIHAFYEDEDYVVFEPEWDTTAQH